MSEKCEYHALFDDSLKRHDYEIRDIKSNVAEIKLSQATVYEKMIGFMDSMSGLPESIKGLTEATLGMQFEIKDIKEDIKDIKDTQNEKDISFKKEMQEVKNNIQIVDEKDKVSILGFIKENLWKILVSLVSFIALYQSLD